MSKPWNPSRKPVALRSSRIRREPVRPSRIRRDPVRHEKEVQAASEERQIWGGVAGVLLIAVALAVAIVGISIATIFNDASGSAKIVRGSASVSPIMGPIAWSTARPSMSRVRKCGSPASTRRKSRARAARKRGSAASTRRCSWPICLNSGEVTVSRPFRDDYGRIVRKVQVKGEDVAENLIGADADRRIDGTKQDWCQLTSSMDAVRKGN